MLSTCKKCSIQLIPGETWSPGMVGNRNHICRECNAAKARAHYAMNAERSAQLQRARLKQPSKAKANAELKNKYYAANKHRWVGYAKTCRAKESTNVWHKAARMLTWIRSRAGKMNCEFDLTHEWIAQHLERGTCQVSGIRFELAKPPGVRIHAWAPSIDRVDSSKGYTQSNCRAVVWIYNMAKSEWGDDAVEILAMAISARLALKRVA